jgi:hypothetical protein
MSVKIPGQSFPGMNLKRLVSGPWPGLDFEEEKSEREKRIFNPCGVCPGGFDVYRLRQ